MEMISASSLSVPLIHEVFRDVRRREQVFRGSFLSVELMYPLPFLMVMERGRMPFDSSSSKVQIHLKLVLIDAHEGLPP